MASAPALEHFPLMAVGVAPSAPPATLHAPWDRRPIATADLCGAEGVDRAMGTAHALFRDRDAWLPAPRRIEILQAAARIMEGRAEALAIGIAREGGKPLVDAPRGSRARHRRREELR